MILTSMAGMQRRMGTAMGFRWQGCCKMTISLMTLVRRKFVPALLLTMLIAGNAGSVTAQGGRGPGRSCWQRPGLETLEETLLLSGKNGRALQAKIEMLAPSRAVLLISNGFNNVAYSAGLIVGWGETGERPRFAAITAVGTSSLIAPFAFIGLAGDPAIADIFNCASDNFEDLAERAASFIDAAVLAAIAREHEAGRRLFIALPGSPARPETVWDIGMIAKSGSASALTIVRDILRASIGPYFSVEPDGALAGTRTIVPGNPAFRQNGSGREFLLPAQLTPAAGAGARYYLIHTDHLSWGESAGYIASREKHGAAVNPELALMPGYDIVRQVAAAGGSFRFATSKASRGLGLIPQPDFDHVILRDLFHRAFRQARMDKEWTREFPGLKLRAARP